MNGKNREKHSEWYLIFFPFTVFIFLGLLLSLFLCTFWNMAQLQRECHIGYTWLYKVYIYNLTPETNSEQGRVDPLETDGNDLETIPIPSTYLTSY